uniref:Thiomorpholine-carboxylate dehydrogenase n=1 Tax=Ditylum brightwellii TaxID=49249 RepID=A0A7S1ZNA6_9STRA
MPIRQVSQLPQNEIQKPGYLVTMPSYHDGYAACKLITVYPQNSNTANFSSHQGVVALFNAKQNGQLLLLADAHQITSTRTAAASAVATMTLARKESHVLAILGTGEQARSHFVSMLETGLPIVQVNLWGRNNDHALKLKEDLRVIFNTYEWKTKCKSTKLIELGVFSTVKECVEMADIICTLVPSTDPILRGEWIRPGTHINAVGACLPTQREMDGTCIAKAALYCDSKDACFVEAGDVVLALKEGSIDSQDHLLGEIGSVLSGEVEGRVNEEQITLFKSLGIALEDLTAVRAIHDAS